MGGVYLPATCPQCFATQGRRVALARPPSALPQANAGRAWNNGVMEDWNIDIKGIISFNSFTCK